ncbi:MAG: 3'-5' exonuclease, partial [Pirellulales bacterium]
AALEPTVSWWDRHRLTQLLDMAIAFEQQGGGRLREFEQMVEEQRVALPTEAQVKVMTIHASKGLEFDAVFLPNMTLSWSGRPPMHIVRADRAGAEPTGVLRYFSGALQQLLPEPWQEAFYNQKVRALDETMCLFYVAVTRARQALYVQTVPRRASKGDKDKKDGTQGAVQQCGSILQSIFASPDNWSEPEAVLFEAGKKDWFAGAASATVRAESPSELQEAPDLSVIALRTDVETSPLRRLEVTRPSVNAAEREHMVLSDVFSKSEVVGAAFGIALHACLEQVKWIEDFRFDERVLIEAIEHKLTPEQLRHVDVKRLLEYFERLLSSAAAKDLLSRRRYSAAPWPANGESLEVENERRVNLLDDGKLLDGTMDRLVKIRKGGRVVAAEIIDFKSDRLPESADPDRWTEARLEAHRGQLTAYRSVTARMLGLSEKSITCSLFLIAARRSITLR